MYPLIKLFLFYFQKAHIPAQPANDSLCAGRWLCLRANGYEEEEEEEEEEKKQPQRYQVFYISTVIIFLDIYLSLLSLYSEIHL